jgi:hypothetical protein
MRHKCDTILCHFRIIRWKSIWGGIKYDDDDDDIVRAKTYRDSDKFILVLRSYAVIDCIVIINVLLGYNGA